MRLLPLLTLVCLASSTLACAADDSADDAAGAGVEPRSGVWGFVGSAPVDDTCMFEDLYVDPPGTFTLTNNGDGSFTIDDGQNVFDCTLTDDDFSCPERLTGENDIGASLMLDAVVEYSVSVAGSFASDTSMTGRQDVTIACNGADCAAIAAVVGVMTPCGWAQDFAASLNQ